VAEETAKDARKAVITLYHDKKHPSSLILPIYDNRLKKSSPHFSPGIVAKCQRCPWMQMLHEGD
jgi:hypothetical protein